jgi:argininosuccinate lyase
MAIRASGIVAPVVSSTQFNLERMEELCDKNFMTATELANWLVKEHDVPFRETHHVVGSLVGAMVKQGKDLTYLDDVVKHLNDTCGLNTSKEEIKPVLTPKDVMLSYVVFEREAREFE